MSALWLCSLEVAAAVMTTVTASSEEISQTPKLTFWYARNANSGEAQLHLSRSTTTGKTWGMRWKQKNKRIFHAYLDKLS